MKVAEAYLESDETDAADNFCNKVWGWLYTSLLSVVVVVVVVNGTVEVCSICFEYSIFRFFIISVACVGRCSDCWCVYVAPGLFSLAVLVGRGTGLTSRTWNSTRRSGIS